MSRPKNRGMEPIPFVPQEVLQKVVDWAEAPSNWVAAGDLSGLPRRRPGPRFIDHHGFEVCYSIRYSRQIDHGRGIGRSPLRHLLVRSPGVEIIGMPFLTRLIADLRMDEEGVMRSGERCLHVLQRLFRL